MVYSKTSEGKQVALEAKYKDVNENKMAKAYTIDNYRAQAKRVPEIIVQRIEKVNIEVRDK